MENVEICFLALESIVMCIILVTALALNNAQECAVVIKCNTE